MCRLEGGRKAPRAGMFVRSDARGIGRCRKSGGYELELLDRRRIEKAVSKVDVGR